MMHDGMPKRAMIVFHTLVVVVGIVLALGLLATLSLGKKTAENMENDLLVRAKNAALLIDADDIHSLEGSNADLVNPVYQGLKEKMVLLAKVNSDVRFLYLMGYDEEGMFFYVDSENPASPDYSPPGQRYPEASSDEKTNFVKGVAFTYGPYSDSWGRWISASAPIIDESTGETAATMGIDLAADDFESRLLYVRGSLIAITILLGSLLLIIALYVRGSVDHIRRLTRENATLTTASSSFAETKRLMKIGAWRWTPQSAFVHFDDAMYDLAGVATERKITYPYFVSLLHPEDRTVLDQALEAAQHDGKDTFDVRFRLIRPADNTSVTIRSQAKIIRNGADGVIAVEATAQAV